MRNKLVQYQGGGYGGCVWEWNYFFLDKDEMFHDVFSSGQDGIETAEQAKELLNCKVSGGLGVSFFTYDMTDDKAIEEFSRECNVVNVLGVLQWFEDNPQNGIEFFILCSECGRRQIDMSELSLEAWHGCGGIASTADKLICSECRGIGICDCCNEYVGESEIVCLKNIKDGSTREYKRDYAQKAASAMQDEDHISHACSYCLEYRAKQIEQEEHNNILQQSLATGKPDMFSTEMRWFWGTV